MSNVNSQLSNLHKTVIEMLEREGERQVAGALDTSKEKYVPIPISEAMILRVLNRQDLEGIHNLDVKIADTYIGIKGTIRKLRMSIHFQIDLEPLQTYKRTVDFRVLRMKPFNQDWIKKVLLNKSSALDYSKGILSIDFNKIDKVRAMPLGNIKKVEIKENKLRVGIGL
ncbi:MAG TPA: hypothetical protein VLK78_03155 [Candidatus Angelobacter sp.]|nr:hypothetical protein [Candidatus Angelobacter sp.]